MQNTPRPDFVDNRDGNTLAAGLRSLLRDILNTHIEAPHVRIATSYFRPEAFRYLADELEAAADVKLLLGAEPARRPPRLRRIGERKDQYHAHLVNESLKALQEGMLEDRNLLGLEQETDEMLERLIAFLRSDRVEVRRYSEEFMHGKAYLVAGGEGVIVGSSNFTPGGLAHNLELNLGRYDPGPVRQVEEWFSDLWEAAEPYDLASLYEARFEAYDPYLIYLRILWELYGDELEEMEAEGISLVEFQRDGLNRAKRMMDRYHGTLVADGVGLGKTYIGGELIRETIYDKRQKALLIAPAALRDGTWDAFFSRHDIRCDVLSYQQLAGEQALGGDEGSYIRHDPDEYSLIVIDEAQAFRNPSTVRAQRLRRLLRGDPPKRLLLLSATPVNNTLYDLYYLISYFARHDAVFADQGIYSLKQRFDEAAAIDPFELRPEVLFDVLDAVCVRRTRHFVKKWYPNAGIPDGEGGRVPVSFPTPRVIRVDYDFSEVMPGFFDELEEALMPEEGPPALTMARYSPSAYRDDNHQGVLTFDELADRAEAHEVQLVGLLRSALLKRFESSVHAFARTAAKMADAHDDFLAALDRGYVPCAETLAEIENVDSDEALEELLREHEEEEAVGYDVEALTKYVAQDRDLLRDYAERASQCDRDSDPKLAALVDELVKIAEQAEADGIGEEDTRDKRKVVVFSYYADTVEWILEFLQDAVEEEESLACYRGRIASVTGASSEHGIRREDAIHGFAPRSTEAPPGSNEDRFDILVTTDVLAEGLNLQQCRHVINYDLPWNPMRVVQRNGRIDRIGSNYPEVFARCVFPDERLNDMLDLEERVQGKLAQAAGSIGLEQPPVPGVEPGHQVFADERREIGELANQNPSLLESHGEPSSAYSGEEYRKELENGLDQRGEEMRSLPWAAGSGHVVDWDRQGWVFCAKIGDRQPYLRFVDAESMEITSNKLLCLRLVTCEPDTERVMPDDLRQGVYEAWEAARADILEEWQAATDPRNLEAKIPKLFRDLGSHLVEHPPQDMGPEELGKLRDSIEAPWGRRIENEFRPLLDDDPEPAVLSKRIAEKVEELGLEPYERPEPLPPIDEDQIMLVCWMGVDGTAPLGCTPSPPRGTSG